MKLHENQRELIKHLIHYRIMDYEDCLWYLDPKGEKDRTARSYMFRPLTKHKYLSKHKDGSVTVLA